MTIRKHCQFSWAAIAVLWAASCGSAWSKGPAYTDPARTDADFPFQGEYAGVIPTDAGDLNLGVQVIALGEGKFQAVGYFGGLPGAGWNGEAPTRSEGARDGEKVVFRADKGSGEISGGVLTVKDANGNQVGTLKKTDRVSDTLGKAPPQGAVVLFNGDDVEQWKDGKRTEDGLLEQGTTSKREFGNQSVHIEFRLPYQPEDRGQGRGNSGIYIQGRYEIQMLDSFGLEGKQNECGGLYSVKDPDVNMCFPPLAWQTYDIDYTAPVYQDGKLVANPRVTVRHNGVLIHRDVELPGERSTTAAPVKPGQAVGPVYLQNHGNPVRYRNIWVVEK